MTTLADFAAVLSRVAARGAAPVRTGRPATVDEACALVLDAVVTCLLPRVMVVTSAGAPCLELAAAGGRVLSVLKVADRTGQATFADLLGKPLGADEAARMGELLRAVLTGGASLEIAFHHTEAAGNGIAPAAMLEAMGLHWDILAPAERLQHLDAATEEVLIGVRTRIGETRLARQDADLSGELVAVLDGCLRDDGLAALLADDEMLLLAHPADCDVAVALVQGEDGPKAMVFDPDVAPDVAALWSELVRPALVHA